MRYVTWSRVLSSSVINRNEALRQAYVDRLQRLSLNSLSANFIANSQSALKLTTTIKQSLSKLHCKQGEGISVLVALL